MVCRGTWTRKVHGTRAGGGSWPLGGSGQSTSWTVLSGQLRAGAWLCRGEQGASLGKPVCSLLLTLSLGLMPHSTQALLLCVPGSEEWAWGGGRVAPHHSCELGRGGAEVGPELCNKYSIILSELGVLKVFLPTRPRLGLNGIWLGHRVLTCAPTHAQSHMCGTATCYMPMRGTCTQQGSPAASSFQPQSGDLGNGTKERKGAEGPRLSGCASLMEGTEPQPPGTPSLMEGTEPQPPGTPSLMEGTELTLRQLPV